MKNDRRCKIISPWHINLNHAPLEALQKMAASNPFPALTHLMITNTDPIKCSSCYTCNITRIQFHPARPQTNRPGELIVIETMGPIYPPSHHGQLHVLTVIYDHTQFYITKPIKTRTQVPYMNEHLIRHIQNNHQCTPSHFHTDNPPEYLARRMSNYLTAQVYVHTTTIPYLLSLTSLPKVLTGQSQMLHDVNWPTHECRRHFGIMQNSTRPSNTIASRTATQKDPHQNNGNQIGNHLHSSCLWVQF